MIGAKRQHIAPSKDESEVSEESGDEESMEEDTPQNETPKHDVKVISLSQFSQGIKNANNLTECLCLMNFFFMANANYTIRRMRRHDLCGT
jgi:hypothetical protein